MFNINNVDRKIELFVFDIYVAILKIDKVSSKFEIIGEATKYLLKDKLLSKEYQLIVDFRNQITHEYLDFIVKKLRELK